MSDSKNLPLYHLYLDDSGTRHPDRAPPTSKTGDWFALGGIIVAEEDEDRARDLHRQFCQKWSITYPLHSVKIRHKAGNFAWLETLSPPDLRRFFDDLEKLITSAPVVGHACVIDRPGYHHRYYEKYGRRRWHLCKTAFSVICERTAKYAIKNNRRIRVYVEETDRTSDNRIRQYFSELRSEGMPFAKESSDKYGPLPAAELKFRLLDLGFKRKSSPMAQLADLYLYPICRGGYDRLYRPANVLIDHAKIVDCLLEDNELEQMGIKYSCFDETAKRAPKDPPPASKSETS